MVIVDQRKGQRDTDEETMYTDLSSDSDSETATQEGEGEEENEREGEGGEEEERKNDDNQWSVIPVCA